jgi:predicted AlkP superfamily pyrophosphatase or phosphodiesterase
MAGHIRDRRGSWRTLLTAVAAVSVFAGAARETGPYVVFMTIDGLKPEAYTTRGSKDVPTLHALAAAGVFARGVVGVLPSLTYPAHTTLITGVPPAVHGIYNNRRFDPDNPAGGTPYLYAREIQTVTLPGAVQMRGLQTAAINWPVTAGLATDFLIPDFPFSSRPEGLTVFRSLARPSTLLEDVEGGGEQTLPWPLPDSARAAIAAWIFRVHRPHLLLLHLVETDTAQHYAGPGSPEAMEAIAAADHDVASVVAAVNDSGLRDRTDIVVASDHGFLPAGPRLQLNTLFKHEGWFRVDGGRVAEWTVYFQPSGGSGFVFLKDPHDVTLLRRVRALLGAVAADPANGVERVISTDELRALGADPRASFAVDMRSGFYTGGGFDVVLAGGFGTGVSGGHGYDPARPDMHASLIMAGPHVPHQGDLGIVRMTEIAPTIAAWFHVDLSPNADQPLPFARPHP